MALLLGDRSQALCLEKLDAVALVTKIRFKTNEDNRCRRAEVQDLGVPLGRLVEDGREGHGGQQ